VLAALVLLERRRPPRRAVEPGWRHDLRNLAVAAASGLVLQLAERPVVEPLSRLVGRRRWGLLPRLGLPRWLEAALAVAAMDYSLYAWHVLTHRLPFLWRCHAVHHADRDLSATTALRFHFAEMLLSVPWRAGQVAIIGVGPGALAAWRACLFASILFHHANLRLPRRLERRLGRLVMTPRLHGIHHSVVRAESDSNWSSGLTLWDRLHGTFRDDVPQRRITIGVPGCDEPRQVTLPRLLVMPWPQASRRSFAEP
jgi:sterol desaturase/sphingolipid hydroxylase (fatty acid hydroxylase superfamily)